jgi:crossover junction endodeoxyribonuclease RuvC
VTGRLVLGIDPGTATTGYGVVMDDAATGALRVAERHGPALRLVECGVIRTRARDPMPARLHEIYNGVRELIARHRPGAMAVEDVFYARNVRTTLALGHARGVVLLAAEQASVPLYAYPPAEIKKAVVGAGGASKGQVQFMLARLLRLRGVPEPLDASDGIAAAVACLLAANTVQALGAAVTSRPRVRVAGSGRPAGSPHLVGGRGR